MNNKRERNSWRSLPASEHSGWNRSEIFKSSFWNLGGGQQNKYIDGNMFLWLLQKSIAYGEKFHSFNKDYTNPYKLGNIWLLSIYKSWSFIWLNLISIELQSCLRWYINTAKRYFTRKTWSLVLVGLKIYWARRTISKTVRKKQTSIITDF